MHSHLNSMTCRGTEITFMNADTYTVIPFCYISSVALWMEQSYETVHTKANQYIYISSIYSLKLTMFYRLQCGHKMHGTLFNTYVTV
jgi:hypothetical protein